MSNLTATRNEMRRQLTEKIGRRQKFSIAIEWPGCINSGAEVTIMGIKTKKGGPTTYVVKTSNSMMKKRSIKPDHVFRDKYGFPEAWWFCKNKKAAITKALVVAAPIIKAQAERNEAKKKAREAMAAGRPDLAAHHMMEVM